MPRFSRSPSDSRLAEAGPGTSGWAWVPATPRDDDPLHYARPGDTVRVAAPPPWLVVAFDLAALNLTGWPGRLLRLRIVEPVEPALQPYAYARYARAMAVAVEGEEVPGALFGPRGEAVVPLLDAAAGLDRAGAERLAAGRDPVAAAAAMDRAWRAWLAGQGWGDEAARGGDLSNVRRVRTRYRRWPGSAGKASWAGERCRAGR